MVKKAALTILLLSLNTWIFSQDLNNLREKTIQVSADSLIIDSLSIIPGTFKAFYIDSLLPIPDSRFTLNPLTPSFFPSSELRESVDSIYVRYRTYPFNWTHRYFNKEQNYNSIDPIRSPKFYPAGDNDNRFDLKNSTLSTTGNLSRGIQIGSTQDASLNSNLNLQLHGKISEKFSIEAQLSDSNIPIQPEGNTQQIQDFDRFIIRIFNPDHEILAGDFSLNSPPGYFIRMNKNLQGMQVNSKFRINQSDKTNFSTRATAAVVKGKYHRMKIAGIEGNQGPYRLNGQNGELYIQIIAGSEQVWIDGKILERGEEADYVINYNTAEIRFTTRILISKDSRITVAYEYTERSYARFMAESSSRWNFENGSVYFNVFSEQDAKNQNLLQEINSDQRSMLAQIGDDLNKALVNNYYETKFVNDRVLYKLTDSLLSGIMYPDVLIYSTNADSAKYQAGFSFVGNNMGNYLPVSSGANGQVYKWIAPIDGEAQGNYEPITRLTTPKSKRVMSLGGEYQLGERMKVKAELALSNNDLNTYSELDRDDNSGSGILARIDRNDPIGIDSVWTVSSFASFRRSGKNFDPVVRYRSVEFERDWNLTDGHSPLTENYFQTGIKLNNKDSLSALYAFDYLSFGEVLKATKHNSTGLLKHRGIALNWSASYLDSDDEIRSTRFARHQVSLSKSWKKLELSVSENHEANHWNPLGESSLQVGSFAFQEWQAEIRNRQTTGIPWFVRIKNRKDYLPDSTALVLDNSAWQAEGGFNWIGKKNQTTRLSANWRRLNHFAGDDTSNKEQTLALRADERFQLLKGGFVSRSFYEIGSGLERKQEFSYLEVPSGQGHYSWTDYNGNGIKELDEFEAAVFLDQANYIRIFRPGTEYIPVYTNRFTQSISLVPARIIDQKHPLFKVLGRLNNQFALSINRKTYRNDLIKYLNPFIINDSLQVSLQAQIRNTLSFNSKDMRFGLDYFFQKTDNQNLMTYGIDSRGNKSHSLVIRIKPRDQIWIHNKTERANHSYNSSFFTSRNYQIELWKNEARITFEPGDITRVNIEWKWSDETNISGAETLTEHRFELGGDIQMPGKGIIHLDVQYINLRYLGNPDTPVAYVMLKGFRPGHNGMANLSVRRQLNEVIQLDFVYGGRLSEGSNIIHTGTVSVRAVF